MELVNAIEEYLVETGQIHPLAKRQARVLGASVADGALRDDARMLLLAALLALGRGAPRASGEFLLGPFARDVVNRYADVSAGEDLPGGHAWREAVADGGALDRLAALVDNVMRNPNLLAPLTGPGPRPGDGVGPLLVVENGRMGFSRYWHSASALETAIGERLRRRHEPVPAEAAASIMRSIFDGGSILPGGRSFHYRQAAAAALALRAPFMVISGGPGTGKTSVVIQVLRALLRAFPAIEPDRIVLCAPTGRAKARLGESVDDGVRKLAERAARDGGGDGARDIGLGGLQRKTLHGLLSLRPDGSTRYRRDNPLPWQVIVVDEASMVDLCLFAGLLDAASPSCRIILVGDMHQLPPVEAGAVLGDLTERFNGFDEYPTLAGETGAWVRAALGGVRCDGGADDSIVMAPGQAERAGALRDRVVILTRSYRSSNEILQLGRHVNRGDHAAALELVRSHGGGAIGLDGTAGVAPVLGWIGEHYERGDRAGILLALREAVLRGTPGTRDRALLDAAFGVLGESRILTLAHGGARGRISINALAERRLRAVLDRTGAGRFFHGQPIILNSNMHDLDLYNGDTGLVVRPKDGGLKAVFRKGGEYSIHSLDRLRDIEPAYAVTVHKAQGSEFDRVLLVLPEHDSPMLTRQVIYTGITRARSRVMILGTEGMLESAVRNREERSGGMEI